MAILLHRHAQSILRRRQLLFLLLRPVQAHQPCQLVFAQRYQATSNRSALNLLPSALQIVWMTSLPLAAAMGTPNPFTHRPIM
jgi:hypothetical protein